MRGRRRRYIPILLLLLGVAFAQGCSDPISDEDFDNPFDPGNPESPFRHQVQPYDGIGKITASGDVVSLSCAWGEIGDAIEYELQWTHSGSFNDAEVETTTVAAVSL